MKILFVIPAYLPAHRYGGPIKSVHELARQLVTLGEDVTVYTTCADGPNDLDVPLHETVEMDGVKVCYFPLEKPRSYFRSPELAKILEKRVANFDIVHINWLYVDTTRASARICRRQGVPYLLAPRGMLDRQAIAMKGSLKKNIYLQLVEKHHLQHAAALHFTSFGERDQAFNGGWNPRGEVVYNGLDLASYPPEHPAEAFFASFPETAGRQLVLFLGRLNYIKGLDLLAASWPQVVAANPLAHLVIAGPDDDGYGEQIRSQFAVNGVSDHVTFTGMLLGANKLAALAAADLFVASSYLESFGMAIIEALAMRKPVVITDRVNIQAEVSGAGAGLVVPCKAENLAAAMLDLLSDADKRRRMGDAGRQLVEEKFTWQSSARQMQLVYRGLIGRM